MWEDSVLNCVKKKEKEKKTYYLLVRAGQRGHSLLLLSVGL